MIIRTIRILDLMFLNRDSKLTKLLADSLAGNGVTLMVRHLMRVIVSILMLMLTLKMILMMLLMLMMMMLMLMLMLMLKTMLMTMKVLPPLIELTYCFAEL